MKFLAHSFKFFWCLLVLTLFIGNTFFHSYYHKTCHHNNQEIKSAAGYNVDHNDASIDKLCPFCQLHITNAQLLDSVSKATIYTPQIVYYHTDSAIIQTTSIIPNSRAPPKFL